MNELALTYWSVFLTTGLFAYLIMRGIQNTFMNNSGKLSERRPGFYRLFESLIKFSRQDLSSSQDEGKDTSKLEIAIRQSGYYLTVRDVKATQMIGLVVGILLGIALGLFMNFALQDYAHDNPGVILLLSFMFVMLLGFMGYYRPKSVILGKARKRSNAIVSELPFAIDLITSSMDAGLDFGAAVRYLLDIMGSNTLNDEFAVFLKDVEMGKTRAEALVDMDKRLAVPEFSRFVHAIVYAIQSGAPVIDIMKVQAEEMRRVKFARAEEQAEKAAGKMVLPTLLLIFPCLYILIGTALFMSIRGSIGTVKQSTSEAKALPVTSRK